MAYVSTADSNGGVSAARLPTNTTTRHHPVHRWYNFIAGFSPEFVSECIHLLPGHRRDVLLDPFAGCGTAQVEGLRNGMQVIGYEAHPIFIRIARAKTLNDPTERLAEIRSAILDGCAAPLCPETLGDKPVDFLSKLFNKSTLSELVGARFVLEKRGLIEDDLAFLVLSKLLELTSHSQTDGIYKAPTSRKNAKSVQSALDAVIGMIDTDYYFSPARPVATSRLGIIRLT